MNILVDFKNSEINNIDLFNLKITEIKKSLAIDNLQSITFLNIDISQINFNQFYELFLTFKTSDLKSFKLLNVNLKDADSNWFKLLCERLLICPKLDKLCINNANLFDSIKNIDWLLLLITKQDEISHLDLSCNIVSDSNKLNFLNFISNLRFCKNLKYLLLDNMSSYVHITNQNELYKNIIKTIKCNPNNLEIKINIVNINNNYLKKFNKWLDKYSSKKKAKAAAELFSIIYLVDSLKIDKVTENLDNYIKTLGNIKKLPLRLQILICKFALNCSTNIKTDYIVNSIISHVNLARKQALEEIAMYSPIFLKMIRTRLRASSKESVIKNNKPFTTISDLLNDNLTYGKMAVKRRRRRIKRKNIIKTNDVKSKELIFDKRKSQQQDPIPTPIPIPIPIPIPPLLFSSKEKRVKENFDKPKEKHSSLEAFSKPRFNGIYNSFSDDLTSDTSDLESSLNNGTVIFSKQNNNISILPLSSIFIKKPKSNTRINNTNYMNNLNGVNDNNNSVNGCCVIL